MSIANPYQPPRADVADVTGSTTVYQPVKFWSWQGRVSRLQYLGYLMGGYLLAIAAAAIFGAIASALFDAKMGPVAGMLALVPYAAFSIIMLVKRTHDMGWSGWTALLIVIPLMALVWMFKAGTPGDNRYGAPPPPNTTKVKILALLMPALAAVGILAAIAIPAYQGYVVRAKAAQAPVQQPAP